MLHLFTRKDRSSCVRKKKTWEGLKHLHTRALYGSGQCWRREKSQPGASVGLQIMLSFIRLRRVSFYCHVLYCTVSMSNSQVHLNVPEHAQYHHHSFMSGIVFIKGGNRAEFLLVQNGSLLLCCWYFCSLSGFGFGCVRVPLRWRLSFLVNENMHVMSG